MLLVTFYEGKGTAPVRWVGKIPDVIVREIIAQNGVR
jgi:hypothetical protein